MGVTVFFGGTFNPPHLAHRKMLETVCGLPNVERVLVAPTNIPPHKEVAEKFASKEDRLKMTKLLCKGLDKAIVSDIEFKRTGKSYSFYTLSELKETYPDLAMLIGGDMVTTFKEWHNYSGILNLCELFVVRRQGIDNLDFDNSVEELRLEGGKITVINADLPDISSTEIREKSKLCVDILSLVPENIVEFIKTTGLYR